MFFFCWQTDELKNYNLLIGIVSEGTISALDTMGTNPASFLSLSSAAISTPFPFSLLCGWYSINHDGCINARPLPVFLCVCDSPYLFYIYTFRFFPLSAVLLLLPALFPPPPRSCQSFRVELFLREISIPSCQAGFCIHFTLFS